MHAKVSFLLCLIIENLISSEMCLQFIFEYIEKKNNININEDMNNGKSRWNSMYIKCIHML